jgi:hypothetical protein
MSHVIVLSTYWPVLAAGVCVDCRLSCLDCRFPLINQYRSLRTYSFSPAPLALASVRGETDTARASAVLLRVDSCQESRHETLHKKSEV